MWLFLFLFLFVLVALGGLYVAGTSRFGSNQLRQAAQTKLSALTGYDVDATIGATGISLDKSRFIALEAHDVTLRARHGDRMVHAGLVRFGIRFLPLLSGRLKLGSATLEDAHIVTGPVKGGGGDWAAGLKDSRGLIDTNRVLDSAFNAFQHAFHALDAGNTRSIDLHNVAIDLPGTRGDFRIVDLDLSRSLLGGLKLSGRLTALGMNIDVDGRAVRDDDSGRISSLDLSLSALRRPSLKVADPTVNGSGVGSVGKFAATITGHEGDKSGPAQLSARMSFASAAIDFGEDGILHVDGDVSVSLARHVPGARVDRLDLAVGSNRLNFHGSITPSPVAAQGADEAAYLYDLVSDQSIAAPAESPEPPVPFSAHMSGRYLPASRQLTLKSLDVRTGPGQMLATGSLDFAPGKAPGMLLAVSVPKMPLQQVKQLWPWFAAPPARIWVLNHVFGGEVTNSNVEFHVATGRLGNGVPLNDDELFGHFKVDETRFDIAGALPPMRDSDGVIDFKGTDVAISLSKGTVFLPDGKTVKASDGTLTLHQVNEPPVIGALDLDVAGDASAITELASFDPINAMRDVGFSPHDFSGAVSGHVTAKVPFSDNIPREALDWKVSLDYTGLSLAKPVAGQKITNADGSITIVPGQAKIDAKARLNGIPADLSLVEPFGKDAKQKSVRDISLTLDDKDRNKLFPGLDELLDGPVSVDVDASSNKSQSISADLGKAKLTLPWIGWSKGAGIPATVSFDLEKDGGVTRLANFKLSSKSFEVSGAIRLSGGSLSAANFSSVRLNEGDDVAVDLKRSGGAYSVTVDGKAFDVRPLIKRLTAQSSAQAAKQVSGGSPISISADVQKVTGFNDTTLSGLNLSYRSSGGGLGDLTATGVTASGGKVSLRTSSQQGRTVSLHAADAGRLLRFLDIYDHVRGGTVNMTLTGTQDGPLHGEAVVKNFKIVNEPRLRSLVSTPAPAPSGERRSLDQALNRNIDVSVVPFERAAAHIEKGDGYLKLDRGVLRGPIIGTTFQGTLYDKQGDMDMTGTFMPAYGLNRLFADIPIVGLILGNGRDRGLIGITYKLSGDAKKPQLEVNPISIIAPGIFRSIFEYQ